AITFGERIGWSTVFVALALLYLPLAVVVLRSPEPAVPAAAPRTLRDAVFDPLVDIFRRSRALQIIGFLLLYKFRESLATALTRPFLIQKCFAPEDVGLATATIGLFAIIGGTFFGGWMTERIGLGRALWIFGAIQAVGFFGYIAVDRMTPGSPCAAGSAAAAALAPPLGNPLGLFLAGGPRKARPGRGPGAVGGFLLWVC